MSVPTLSDALFKDFLLEAVRVGIGMQDHLEEIYDFNYTEGQVDLNNAAKKIITSAWNELEGDLNGQSKFESLFEVYLTWKNS